MSDPPTGWTDDRLKDLAAINAAALSAGTDPDYEFDSLEISNVDYHGIVDSNAIERLRFEDAPSRAPQFTADGTIEANPWLGIRVRDALDGHLGGVGDRPRYDPLVDERGDYQGR